MFTDFLYLLRSKGLKVSLVEWTALMEALEQGLARASLTGFYYLSRAVLVKTEADFDRFDLAFAEYFRDVKPVEELPPEVLRWLEDPKEQRDFDKDEVDGRTTFSLERLQQLFEERLKEQDARHDGGTYWVGTGGTSVFGRDGYAATGVRVGGEGRHRHALQVAGERSYRDFRDDSTLDMRQFQMAFRRLRQFSPGQDGPRTVLDLDQTIRDTCDNAGKLRLSFTRPRVNAVKLMILFDSGGSMWPYADLCNQLFRSVSKASHFRAPKIFYFHNCFYDRLYTTPSCQYTDSVESEWVLEHLDEEYKVIVVGDAAMAPSELLMVGGSLSYVNYNRETGLEWLRRFTARYEKMVWFNPLPESSWQPGHYGAKTIQTVGQEVAMFHLSVKGLEAGLKHLVKAR